MSPPPRTPPLAALCLAAAAGVGSASAGPAGEHALRVPDASSEAAPPERVRFRAGEVDDRNLNRSITGVSVATLTVYPPAAQEPPRPGVTVVVCPGGGYTSLAIDKEGHAVARWLQAAGVGAVVLKYRLPDPAAADVAPTRGLPLPQEDVLTALRSTREHAEAWGLDAGPGRVGVLGFSAGGHLAGSAAVFGKAADGSRPDFVALLYPVVTMHPPHVNAGSRRALLGERPGPDAAARFSLEQRVTPGMPPFFLAHAADDTAVPPENSGMLAEALRAVGTPVELLELDSGGHGFGLGRDAESARWKDTLLAWLDRLP